MKPGDIVLAIVPQNDEVPKRRPTLILKEIPPFNDYLICGISTQLRHFTPNLDEIIAEADDDFGVSQLKEPSLIRAGWLETVTLRKISGVIGHISEARLQRLRAKLASFICTA